MSDNQDQQEKTALRTLVFSGKVLPERAFVDFGRPYEIRFSIGDNGATYHARLHIYANQVVVTVKTPSTEVNIPTVKNAVEGSVRVLTDFVGYLHGHGYDVEITSVWDSETGKVTVFGIDVAVTSDSKKERRAKLGKLLPVVLSSSEIQLALADLREAIRSPGDTGFFSYRAIETLMQTFKDDGDDAKKGWSQMRAALNLDEQWLKYVRRHATDRRHGKGRSISWEERRETMSRAWLVMDRYLEYLSKDRKPLAEAEFPTMTA